LQIGGAGNVAEIKSFYDVLLQFAAFCLRVLGNENCVRRYRTPEGARLQRNNVQTFLKADAFQLDRKAA